MSPNDETSSPTKLSSKLTSSPPVGSFVETSDCQKETVVLRDEPAQDNTEATEPDQTKDDQS